MSFARQADEIKELLTAHGAPLWAASLEAVEFSAAEGTKRLVFPVEVETFSATEYHLLVKLESEGRLKGKQCRLASTPGGGTAVHLGQQPIGWLPMPLSWVARLMSETASRLLAYDVPHAPRAGQPPPLPVLRCVLDVRSSQH